MLTSTSSTETTSVSISPRPTSLTVSTGLDFPARIAVAVGVSALGLFLIAFLFCIRRRKTTKAKKAAAAVAAASSSSSGPVQPLNQESKPHDGATELEGAARFANGNQASYSPETAELAAPSSAGAGPGIERTGHASPHSELQGTPISELVAPPSFIVYELPDGTYGARRL